MSTQVRDCKTAAEVMENFREVRSRMLALAAPKPPPPPPPPEPPPLPPQACPGSLDDWRPRELGWRIGPRDIQIAVCMRYGIAHADLVGPSRSKRLMLPRQVSMWLLHEVLDLTLTAVANRHRRDHTTVLHGQRKVAALLDTDAGLRADIDYLLARIRAWQ